MTQPEFTEFITSSILNKFPQFLLSTESGADLILLSPLSKLRLWISTENAEVTLGLTGNQKLNDWHTHMSLFGATNPNEELTLALKLIDEIINDQVVITFSSLLGYFFSEDNGNDLEYQQEGEIIEWFYWSEL